jgi:hypothetical protein
MRWLALALVIACGGEASLHYELISKDTEFKDKICSCRGPACARKVAEERAAYNADERVAEARKGPFSDEETAKLHQLDVDYRRCFEAAIR